MRDIISDVGHMMRGVWDIISDVGHMMRGGVTVSMCSTLLWLRNVITTSCGSVKIRSSLFLEVHSVVVVCSVLPFTNCCCM